jgi:hypothetical protein
MGLLIPFGVIYTDDLLDTKIKSRLDFDGKNIIPFIGIYQRQIHLGNESQVGTVLPRLCEL